jgi:NADH dehydrogenase/NADH:ubiquinone oxidoreductase subunit G
MKVFTHSELAIKAQKGVMEFLLINHPLDCPICDQGGECQLQDLAVGYGGGASRFQEDKRVVFHKDVGPLISMQEMARCIHCTRCVRFGQEIAGVMELGMANRNMHSEIMTFVGRSVDSELSGNMIDLCPVGALTSKPFRYAARSWELGRRKSISPHDSVGANLTVQVKNNVVMRVLPRETRTSTNAGFPTRSVFLRGAEFSGAADETDGASMACCAKSSGTSHSTTSRMRSRISSAAAAGKRWQRSLRPRQRWKSSPAAEADTWSRFGQYRFPPAAA